MSRESVISFVYALGILACVVSPLTLAAGGWFWWESRSLVKSALATSGVVVELERDTTGGEVMYTPVFEFQDHAGRTHRSIAGWSRSSPAYRIGETVEVLYRKSNPVDARIRSFVELWLLPLVLLSMGAFFLLAGVVTLVLVPRLSNKHGRARKTGHH